MDKINTKLFICLVKTWSAAWDEALGSYKEKNLKESGWKGIIFPKSFTDYFKSYFDYEYTVHNETCFHVQYSRHLLAQGSEHVQGR